MDAQVKPPFGWYADTGPNGHPHNQNLGVSLLFNEGAGVDLVNSCNDVDDVFSPFEIGAYVNVDATAPPLWSYGGLTLPDLKDSKVVLPKENIVSLNPEYTCCLIFTVKATLAHGQHLFGISGPGDDQSNGEWVLFYSTSYGFHALRYGTTFTEVRNTTPFTAPSVGDRIKIIFTSRDSDDRTKIFGFFPDGSVTESDWWYLNRYLPFDMVPSSPLLDLLIGGNHHSTTTSAPIEIESFRVWGRAMDGVEAREVAAQPYAGYRSPRIDTRTLAAILAAGGGGAAIDTGPLNIGIGIGL